MKFKPTYSYSWTKARAKKRLAYNRKHHPSYAFRVVKKRTVGKAHKLGYVFYYAKKR